MIIRFPWLHKNYIALTIWPFILIKEYIYIKDKRLINHENIHLRQQIELLWVPFFLWYVIEFVIKYVIYKKWDLAYRAISFEREAYTNENKPAYLKNRKLWSFWKYLKY